MKWWIPGLDVRVTSLLCALAALAVVGGASMLAPSEPAPAPVVVVVAGGPLPDADAGPSLPDACSRRVGCLLR